MLSCKGFQSLSGSSCSSQCFVRVLGLFRTDILYQHHSCEAPRILPAGSDGDVFGQAVFHHGQMRGLETRTHPHFCAQAAQAVQCKKAVPKTSQEPKKIHRTLDVQTS